LRHGQGGNRCTGVGKKSARSRRYRLGAESLQHRTSAHRQQHCLARTQARHSSRRQSQDRRRPPHARFASERRRHARLDSRAAFSRCIQMTTDLPTPDYAQNMRIIGHTDQGGRPDGVQAMVHRGYAYVGHMFSKGFSIIDVRDAKNPRAVNYLAAPPNTWNIHLQVHDDLLLVIHAKDMFAAAEFADERAYYSGALGKTVGTAEARRERDWSAGLAVYDLSQPDAPRRIGFMPVRGGRIHRVWYTGGPWAYASVLLDGFPDYIFMTIDMRNPAQPREAGRWWIPGMNLAAGEAPSWAPARRYGLHHAIIHGDTAYAAW